MLAVRTPGAPQTARADADCNSAFPTVGIGSATPITDRFRGYVPVHCHSGLQPPCLRFAAAVTGRHARLGTRLLARLCHGRHLRRLSSTRLQGATPHRTVRAAFLHTAPTSDVERLASRPSVRAPAPVTRFPGTGSGTCGIGSRSPWPPPFAPPPPLPVARLCSAASLLLWRSLTSHARASSASVPHLPDAGQSALSLWPDMRPLRFRRVPFGRDGAFDPGGATASRMAMPHMLPSTGSERLGLRNVTSFVAQSPTPSDHCVRFASAVADD